MIKLLLVLGIVLAVALVLLRRHTEKRTPYRELLAMCRGDERRARRLIEAEKARRPALSDTQAARRAVLSWQRDLR